MAAVSAFLQTPAPRPYPAHYMDTAMQTYRETCKYGLYYCIFPCTTTIKLLDYHLLELWLFMFRNALLLWLSLQCNFSRILMMNFWPREFTFISRLIQALPSYNLATTCSICMHHVAAITQFTDGLNPQPSSWLSDDRIRILLRSLVPCVRTRWKRSWNTNDQKSPRDFDWWTWWLGPSDATTHFADTFYNTASLCLVCQY